MAGITLSTETKINLGLAIAVMSGVLWLVTEVRGVRRDLDDLHGTVLTKAQAAEQALRLAIHNPGLKVPDPRDPDKVIQVTGAHVFTGEKP